MNQPLQEQIEARWNSRTKPQGSLGRLEAIARDYCLMRDNALPSIDKMGVYLYAGDHGVTEEGISLFPKSVTRQMVANFEAGGAAVNVLARAHDINVHVIDAGVGEGTRNFAREMAMTLAERDACLAAGAADARRAAAQYQLVGVGEMGIGNTTSAAAILAALGNTSGAEAAGRGTGLDEAGVRHKATVIDRAVALHELHKAPAGQVLAAVGGFEIARMTGFLIEAARLRLPVVMDGFITCAAALVAVRLEPATRDFLFFSHRSAERGHGLMLDLLDADPILELDMRLGEGSGAILGMHLIDCSLKLYREMASFESADVSRSNS